MFLFDQALAGQVVRGISEQTCQLFFYSLNVLIGNALKLHLGTSTNLPHFTTFLLKYCAIINFKYYIHVLLDCRNNAGIT